jgi:hypothetical protein
MNADDDSNIRIDQEAAAAGEQFARIAQSFALNEGELSSIKASVLSYAAANPIGTLAEIAVAVPSPAPRSWYAAHSMRFAVLAAIVLLCGATTVGAERALPGDALYPFKRAINDRAIEAVAIGAEAEAHASITLAERRLAEIERIALDVEAPIALADEINEATANAELHIANARAFIAADAGVAVQALAVADSQDSAESAASADLAAGNAPEQSARSMKMMAIEVATAPAAEEPSTPESDSSVDERLAAVISAHGQALARIKGLKPDASAVIEVTADAINEASVESASASDEEDPVYVDLREEAVLEIETDLDIKIEIDAEDEPAADAESRPEAREDDSRKSSKRDEVSRDEEDAAIDINLKAEVKAAADSLLEL